MTNNSINNEYEYNYNINSIINEISLNLEDIAKSIIYKEIEIENNNLIKLHKQQFLNNVDSIDEHMPSYHQWGIITHTKQFLNMYDNVVKKYILKWGFDKYINDYLQIKIDGIEKSKLIYIGILFHDLGKLRKKYIINSNLEVKISFNNHEKYSAEIIKEELNQLLKENYKLTNAQIEYIAMCANYHFKLGFIRKVTKKNNKNYDFNFIDSDDFKSSIIKELPYFEEYKIEVGLLFLGDSCAKTDIKANSDSEILSILKQKNLNLNLIKAIKQKDINIYASQKYFEIILEKENK